MLNLPKRKSTFNFFESFSDLVFCTLVMFLVLVLFLAMNVGKKQKQVAVEQQSVTQTQERIAVQREEAEQVLAEYQQIRDTAQTQIDTERTRLQEQLEAEVARIEQERQRVIDQIQRDMARERERIDTEVNARRQALSIMEQEVARQRRVYEQALGSNRFTGLPVRPRLVVAYDWQPNRIGIHPVPAWLVDELNATPPGLSDQQLADYYTALRIRFMEQVRDVPPLTPRQYRALIRTVSVGLEPVPRVGNDQRVALDMEFAVDGDGVPTAQVGVVIPGGNAEHAGIAVGDELIAMDDAPVTPGNVGALLARYRPGDTARVLVRREDRPVAIELTFREVRVIELVEAYRTDLSMVVSGALDMDYTFLWEAAQVNDLRARLQQGRASDAVWQGRSRWEDRGASEGRPVLRFDVDPQTGELIIGEQHFSMTQFRRVLEALGGGGIVVEYTPEVGPQELPEIVYQQALRPTGFVIRAPQLDQLLEQTD